jgi:RNA polymerase sigma factor (sigma-70 family)
VSLPAASPTAATHDAANASPDAFAPVVDSAQLTARIAAGDEQAFAEFYAQWFAPAVALAKALVRADEAAALDLVQDVMLAVAERMPPLRGERAVRAWLATAIVRAGIDRHRQQRRRAQREQGIVAGRDTAEPPAWASALEGERAAWLQARLAELSPVEQALVAARFSDSVSVAAVGGAFGLGEDQAHGRLRRVMQRLRRKAAEWWHGS